MHITAVDNYGDLFAVIDVVSAELQKKILSTPWLDLKFVRQVGQESWPRRKIVDTEIPWLDQWNQEISEFWTQLEQALQVKLLPYTGTAFWLDEPGFSCPLHTDGEMPGSLHLNWIGHQDLATTFYHYQTSNSLRFQQPFRPNSGYVMTNSADETGYRKLQWHGMLCPVPANTFRLTSYTWVNPVK